jgi:hypothetical protein
VCGLLEPWALVCGLLEPWALVCGLLEPWALVCGLLEPWALLCGLLELVEPTPPRILRVNREPLVFCSLARQVRGILNYSIVFNTV